MKIAYFVSSLKKCGPNVVIFGLIKQLKNKYDVEILYLDEEKDNFLAGAGANVTKVENIKHLRCLFSRFDVVHSNGIRPDLFSIIAKITYRKDFKLVTTIHNYVYQDLYYSYGLMHSIFYGTLWGFIWLFFSKVVVLSQQASKYYWFIPKNKKSIIANGIECKKYQAVKVINYRNKYNIPSSAILIGTCANFTKRKGIDIIINELTKRDDIYFIAAGNGIEKGNLVKQVYDCGLQSRVIFMDFLKDPQDFMSQLDIFVMPSRNEGFGLTVLEATNVGVPVITSDLPIFKELFENMTVSFQLNDTSTFSQAVDYLIKNKSTLSKQFRNNMAEKYAVEIMALKYEQVYLDVI